MRGKLGKIVKRVGVGLLALLTLLAGLALYEMWDDSRPEVLSLGGVDGPYVTDSLVYYVDSENRVTAVPLNRADPLPVNVDNADADRFYVRLKERIETQPDTFPAVERLIALSDIEGNFNGFASFLQGNHVVNEQFDWIFGNGHLVLVGDFVDRGHNVLPVLWLIYKLEEQAERQGGRVHYILGNHELMNIQGKPKYNAPKYKKIATIIGQTDDTGEAVRFVYSAKTELGRWLNAKNVMEKIGDYLFVHAGTSPELLAHRLSIPQVNTIARASWAQDLYNNPGSDPAANFLIGRMGVCWYRGLAKDYKHYGRIRENELDSILAYYNVRKIVFGHTVVDDITADFNGKAINIDLRHGQEKRSGRTRGILVERGIEYKIDDTGKRTAL